MMMDPVAYRMEAEAACARWVAAVASKNPAAVDRASRAWNEAVRKAEKAEDMYGPRSWVRA
jgi:hypothetical protein